ncbi:MAG: hypothetical protein M1818_002382 [Claussenomyces sp. TS43310]|nr:MAG: hypothetical protein M1818_002382 [Claussenomyces sp. TS43310]
MSPKDAKQAFAVKPTEAELNFIVVVFSSQKSKPAIDWSRVAELLNYHSPAVASQRWYQITRRLGLRDVATPSSTPQKRSAARINAGNPSSPPKTPSTSPRKRHATLTGRIGKGGGARPSPAVKEDTKRGAMSAKLEHDAEEDGEVGEELEDRSQFMFEDEDEE